MPGGQGVVDGDSVRIDDAGIAHPAGERASAALLQHRGGDLQRIPSPENVLVLRGLSEAATDARRLWLAGEVARPGRLLDIVSLVAQAKWWGELLVDDGSARRSVYVRDGKVIGASSTARTERLGEMLRHDGELTEEQLRKASSEVNERVRFGDAAVRLGFVGRETLFRYLHLQTEEIVYAALAVARGAFTFYEHVYMPLSFPLSMSLTELMFEAVRRIDAMDVFRERVPSSQHIPKRIEGQMVDARDDGYQVYLAINGERSVEEVAAAAGRGMFETTRQIDGLKKKGAVTVRPPGRTGPKGLVHAFNDAMMLIMMEVDRYGVAARSVRGSLASFAARGDDYQALFAGAGPDEDGCLDPERVVANLRDMPDLDHAELSLAGWLYEYAAFAMFIAEPVLRAGALSNATAISGQVAKILAPLSPDF